MNSDMHAFISKSNLLDNAGYDSAIINRMMPTIEIKR